MLATIEFDGINYEVDLSQGKDISIPLIHGEKGPKCFYAPDFRIAPVVAGDFIGDTLSGSPVNFKNIFINPHGNGTHTECVGHITKEVYTIHQCLREFHFVCYLASVKPHLTDNGEKRITLNALQEVFSGLPHFPACILRTLPNDVSKMRKDYSGTNPPYFEDSAMQYLVDKNIQHLITDLPSVDREVDGGQLSAHKIFWQWPEIPYLNKTITEMVYIPDAVEDGFYFCQIQICSLESDASPSKILLYDLNKIS